MFVFKFPDVMDFLSARQKQLTLVPIQAENRDPDVQEDEHKFRPRMEMLKADIFIFYDPP